MNRIEQLKNEQRAWSVGEIAAYLGYSKNYIYELIHKRQIGGWFRVERKGRGKGKSSYRFCPYRFALWLEGRFGDLAEGGGNGHK